MVRPKKQSKRMTTKRRQKIQKKLLVDDGVMRDDVKLLLFQLLTSKPRFGVQYNIIVREHKRKQKKENAQKTSKKKNKDPGVPNLCPFKEKVLREVENRKQKQEEEKQRRKEKRLKEVNKKRNLQSLQQDAVKRGKEYERKVAHKKMTEDLEKTHVGCPLEISRKAYYKEFKKVVDNSDVVLEVLDARDPLGCRCFKVEEAVLSAGSNKKIVLVLNKIDLVPASVVNTWLKHLRNEFPTIAFKASTQTQKQHLAQSKVPTSLASGDLLSTSKCMGAATLMKLLGNYCRSQDIKTSITVGVVGFPNVGKSSLINSLKRSKSCTVGATPGVTKNMQEVQLDKHVKLLDSPGIVMDASTSDVSIILRNCVKIESLDDVVTPVEAILKRCNKQQVMEKYRIPDYRGTQEFLCELAKRLGKLKKGGVPDVNAAAKAILCDWNSGKIVFYTHPPEQHFLPAHLSAEIVQRWGTEFDVASLEKEESEEMKNMKDLTQSLEDALVLMSSKPSEIRADDKMDDSAEEDCEDGKSDDGDEEAEEMEDDGDKESHDITVVLNPNKTSALLSSKSSTDSNNMNQFNLQANKSQKKAFKKKQREKRKSAQPVTKMEDRMTDSDDDYDFETDLM